MLIQKLLFPSKSNIWQIKNNFSTFQRLFSQNPSTSNLALLRKRTGLAFTLCKKALDAHENDLKKAELWLKEEALKFGYQKAHQLQNRRARQGLICVYVDDVLKRAILLELNCETDFVARNETFRNLAATLTRSIAKSSRAHCSHDLDDKSIIFRRKKIGSDILDLFNDKISNAILHLGENIKLSRALLFYFDPKSHHDIKLFGYAHASGSSHQPIDEIFLGQYGSIVALKQLTQHKNGFKISAESEEFEIDEKLTNENFSFKKVNEEKEDNEDQEDNDDIDDFDVETFAKEKVVLPTSLPEIGKLLCQHVIGLNPKYLRKSEQDLIKEKERQEQGYKFLGESEFLMNQTLISNDKLTVEQFIESQNIQLLDFVRFECGEDFDTK